MEAFQRETKTPVPERARNGLDALIGKATGWDAAFAEAFVAWFNVHVWGDEVPVRVTVERR